MSLFGYTCTVGGSQVLTHLLFLSPREQGISLGLKLYRLGGGGDMGKAKAFSYSSVSVLVYMYIFYFELWIFFGNLDFHKVSLMC